MPHSRLLLCLLLAPFWGCASTSVEPPLGLGQPAIDLDRFLGDWYVIAHLPAKAERLAHNAVESYSRRDDGRIAIRFSFCEGAPEGPLKVLDMVARVVDPDTSAAWRVRPRWPLEFAYRVLELDPEYEVTVIGHPSGRWAWIMARDREVPDEVLEGIRDRLAEQGYRVENFRRVPQVGEACR